MFKYSNLLFQINSIHVDPLEEPIVDLSGGGQDIPNQPQGFVSVWVVTIDGRVSIPSWPSSVIMSDNIRVHVPQPHQQYDFYTLFMSSHVVRNLGANYSGPCTLKPPNSA